MRTPLMTIALAGVFALSAAHAQTAPAPPAGTAKAAPARDAPAKQDEVQQGMRLGANIGDLVKAAVAQQQAQRAAQGRAAQAGATATTADAANAPATVAGADIAAVPQDTGTP